MDPEQAVDTLTRLRTERPGRRLLVGLVGPPGVGKSTVADAMMDSLGSDAVLVPMDGFHLSNEVLNRRGARNRKGAPDTFDVDGYLATLRRCRADDRATVFAPRFHREIEESIAAEIEISPSHRVVITEGNYLLLDQGLWTDVRDLLDVVWYLDLADEVRIERLVARHVRYGKSHTDARAWALGSDQRNADLIAASAHRADDKIELT